MLKPLVLSSLAVLLGGCAAAHQHGATSLRYQQIALSPEPVEQPLLRGPPQTAGMRSGRVVLKAGEAMHRHSTHAHEELLVFQKGQARVVVGGERLVLVAGEVLYIPPHTEHELFNDGPDELRYIYTVAPVTGP